MNGFKDLITNYIFICAFSGWFLAQLAKLVIGTVRNRRFDFAAGLASGGMPSSHSSAVCAMTVACGRVEGLGTPLFAISLILSFIVMYDAAGVRRAAGEQAKILNSMMEAAFEKKPDEFNKQLKELIGHTPFEVFVGAILGILIPYALGPLFL